MRLIDDQTNSLGWSTNRQSAGKQRSTVVQHKLYNKNVRQKLIIIIIIIITLWKQLTVVYSTAAAAAAKQKRICLAAMAVSIKKEEKEEGRKKEERSGLRVDATTFANATLIAQQQQLQAQN